MGGFEFADDRTSAHLTGTRDADRRRDERLYSYALRGHRSFPTARIDPLATAADSLPPVRKERPVSLIDDVGLAPLPGDLVRVEDRLNEAVRADDRFLGDVAGHLLAAGGKRLRPDARAVRGLRRGRRGAPATAEVVTGGAAVELVHLGSLYHDDVIDEAETRRGVPSVNARWSNIVAILAGDYLLAQASVARGVVGRRRRRPAGGDDRRAVPRSGARAAAPVRRRPAPRSRTSRRSRARPRR